MLHNSICNIYIVFTKYGLSVGKVSNIKLFSSDSQLTHTHAYLILTDGLSVNISGSRHGL